MKISITNPNRIEPWDYRNVFDQGIGGSETSAVEMSIRLAARGHDVTCFTEQPADIPDREFRGVHWRDLEEVDLNHDGLWVIYRAPSVGARIEPTETRKYWLVAQDIFYPDWRSADVAKFERVIGLCPAHIADIARRDPANAGWLSMSSNGVNVERVCRVIAEEVERIPTRLIWASSPDRGLKETLDIFERAREQVPSLELHVFYGMDNIEKVCGGDRGKYPWRESWKQYDRACAMPGVTWRGRIGQDALAREWATAGIWLYPTWFSETSCISCMEAQCYGAVPVSNPIWATGYNIKHGMFIQGAPNDPLVKARYVQAVVQLASNPQAQERIRTEMMPEARQRLDWERFVDQWEGWVRADFVPTDQWEPWRGQNYRESTCS